MDRFDFIGGYDLAVEDAGLIDAAFLGHSRRQLFVNAVMAGSRRDELCDQLNSAGNLGTGNRVNISNGSSQSARKNTASVSAELIANSTTSSLSRARDMTRNANATLFSGSNANA